MRYWARLDSGSNPVEQIQIDGDQHPNEAGHDGSWHSVPRYAREGERLVKGQWVENAARKAALGAVEAQRMPTDRAELEAMIRSIVAEMTTKADQ